jgi:DNA-binding NtrC family response regulator
MFDTPTLLVVDDEAAICGICRRILKKVGFQVHVSRDAPVGLGRAVAEDYSAILLDTEMPQMNGFQFLEEIRKMKPSIPVMLMTSHPSIETAITAIQLGASEYITKPFTEEQLIKSVRKMLSSANGEALKRQHKTTAMSSA